MTDVLPTIELFDGIAEDLDNVSLRRDRQTGGRNVLLRFRALKALDRFNSFRSRFSKAIRLTDSEGAIELWPDSSKLVFGGDDGDELDRVEFVIPIDNEDHWQRFMRFMERYAAANGMTYGDRQP